MCMYMRVCLAYDTSGVSRTDINPPATRQCININVTRAQKKKRRAINTGLDIAGMSPAFKN